jgi:hypothetical protein
VKKSDNDTRLFAIEPEVLLLYTADCKRVRYSLKGFDSSVQAALMLPRSHLRAVPHGTAIRCKSHQATEGNLYQSFKQIHN